MLKVSPLPLLFCGVILVFVCHIAQDSYVVFYSISYSSLYQKSATIYLVALHIKCIDLKT